MYRQIYFKFTELNKPEFAQKLKRSWKIFKPPKLKPFLKHGGGGCMAAQFTHLYAFNQGLKFSVPRLSYNNKNADLEYPF